MHLFPSSSKPFLEADKAVREAQAQIPPASLFSPAPAIAPSWGLPCSQDQAPAAYFGLENHSF